MAKLPTPQVRFDKTHHLMGNKITGRVGRRQLNKYLFWFVKIFLKKMFFNLTSSKIENLSGRFLKRGIYIR